MSLKINQIFTSVQGEGDLIGHMQFFIRLSGCNLRCPYCDTRHETVSDITEKEIIENIKRSNIHSVSITGGEPLLQAEHLKSLIDKIKSPIMLETNATLPTQLTGIINDIDYISADYKPFFHRDNYDIFKDFVQISSKKECVIKLVYDKNTEIMGDIESITEDFPNIPVFIQPVTPFDNEDIRLGMDIMKKYGDRNIRLVPQVHPFLEIE